MSKNLTNLTNQIKEKLECEIFFASCGWAQKDSHAFEVLNQLEIVYLLK